MRSFDELDTLWRQLQRPPRDRGAVHLIVVRLPGGRRELPERVELSPQLGVHGDRWSLGEPPDPDYQVTLLNTGVAELVAHGEPLELFGDNFLVDLELAAAALPIGARLGLGTALLEISPAPHTGCKKFRERFGSPALRWVNHKDNRPERLRGVNCRVIEAGVVARGDVIEVLSR